MKNRTLEKFAYLYPDISFPSLNVSQIYILSKSRLQRVEKFNFLFFQLLLPKLIMGD